MIVTIQPSPLSGTIIAPASKSCMQRACALALLHTGKTIIKNPGFSDDDIAALNIIQDLGAIVTKSENEIIITSNFPASVVKSKIFCGESGLSIRMFTPIAALSSEAISITGAGSLLNRPVNFFDEVLPQSGVSVSSADGKPPLNIQGPLVPKDITIDGSLSSQFVTGLLLAFSKSCKDPVTIHVKDPASKPYIQLTVDMMRHFGRVVDNFNFEKFILYPEKITTAESITNTITYDVEADWSSASFLLVAAAIAGKNVTIRNLNFNSAQADKKIMDALRDSGASFMVKNNEVTVNKSSLKPFKFDATDCPDLFPPLVALASFCTGTSVIKGVHRLDHKESNRAQTLQQEFSKSGVNISIVNNEMHITSTGSITGAEVHSHHDHRIAMACAVAACGASAPFTINNAEAVNKSYPGFFEHLQKLNVSLQKT